MHAAVVAKWFAETKYGFCSVNLCPIDSLNIFCVWCVHTASTRYATLCCRSCKWSLETYLYVF